MDPFGAVQIGKRVVRMDNAEGGDQRAVLKGSHKLIEDRATGARELYDLSRDPGERRNRVDDPKLAVELAELAGLL